MEVMDERDAWKISVVLEAIRPLVKDLVATLGWTLEDAIGMIQSAGSQTPGTLMGMAEDVQQWLHDTFLDTTWPACPDHGRHPLWLADAEPLPVWTCEESGRAVCRLGELGTAIKIDDAAARMNRERLAANRAADAATMERFRRPSH